MFCRHAIFRAAGRAGFNNREAHYCILNFVPYSIRTAETFADLEAIRALLREYGIYLNDFLGSEHIDPAEYERELTNLPSPYQVLLIAFAVAGDGSEEAAGCVLLKPMKEGCEMKRLWVRPQFQGCGIGRKLVERLIDEARQGGYSAMYLDTLPAMETASYLYRAFGFAPVERYNDNPAPDVTFFRLNL